MQKVLQATIFRTCPYLMVKVGVVEFAEGVVGSRIELGV
jgi:hypothetical protein